MQNVSRGTVSDSDKDNSSQNSDSNLDLGTDRKCETYADIQDIYSSSGESDSEEDISEVDSFVLGEGEEEVGVELFNREAHCGLLNNSYNVTNKRNFLLAAAHASAGSVSDFCVGDCTGVQSLHHHHHSQPQFDPDTQARLVALLEAADPEVLRRLTSSVSSALDEAAAALTRMRTDTSVGGSLSSAAIVGPGPAGSTSSSSSNGSSIGSNSSSSNNSCSSSSSSGGNGSGCSTSSSRSSGTPSGAQRTLVEACSDGDVHAVKRLLDEGRSVHETTEEGESLLSLTCSAGYFDLAQVLLAMRANVEDRGMKGDCTPLMEAASAGHVQIVKLLIAHNADVNAQSSSGNTPLMYACGGGHTEVVKVLLDHGANVEDHNENGHTPLMEAASSGHVSVAKLLLDRGAGINTSSNEFKESALTLACYKGHLEMVKFLLDAGADQEHKTDEMHTALMEASMDGHVEVARLLLDSGAQVNMPADSFESPLTLAACGGHSDLALLLLERGANIEEVNDEGYTPLMEAAREGHEEMVTLLLAHGADINAQTEETQETALTLACCGGFKEVASILLKAGADLELGASTPLMEAAQEGHRDLVRYLLEMGTNVNAQTSTGDTALTYACENGHTDVAGYLLRANANLEHESEGGRTPLMKACRAGHICTVQFLVMRGADVNRTTADNDHTPLSLACVGGHLRIVEFLLANGADPHHKLKDNSTMLMEASKGGHTMVVKLLMDYPNSLTQLSTSASGTGTEVSVENSQVSGVTNQSGQHLSMGLTVVPGQEGSPQLATTSGTVSSVVSPAVTVPSQVPLPDVAEDSLGAQSLSQKNIRPATTKSNKKNAAPSATSYLAENLCATQSLLKDEFQLDETPRSPAKFLDALKREVEHAHYSREEQILSKQLILEQLHRAEKHIGSVAGAGGCFNSLIAEAGSVMNSTSSASLLSSAINNQVLYSNGSLPAVLPHSTQTVETQTGFLTSSSWTVLPSGMGIGDLSTTFKPSSQLPSPLYANSTATQIPVSFAAPENSPETLPPTSTQETSCDQYISPSSPSSASSSFSNTSPPVNIPIHERRKMIPSKKQLDKKKLQLQQQQIQLQHLSGQAHSHHPCALHHTPSIDGSYACSNLQSSVSGASIVSTASHVCSNSVPPQINSNLDNSGTMKKKDDKPELGLLIKPKPDPTKLSKKEKKKGIGSVECDCGMHDEELALEATIEADSYVPTTSLSGQPFSAGSASGNLQFVPGVPVQYSNLNTIRQVSGNQSAVTAAVVAQQLQGVSSTSNFTSTSTSCSSAINSQSQLKQFLLNPAVVSNTTASVGHHALSSTITSTQNVVTSQYQTIGSTPQMVSKKTKKGLLADLDPQQQLETLKKYIALGNPTQESVEHKQSSQQQPLSSSDFSNVIADLGQESAINSNILCPTNLTHLPVTSLPLTCNSDRSATKIDSMYMRPDSPYDKLNSDILGDLLCEAAGPIKKPQVGTNQVGVPYFENEASGLYSNAAVGTNTCPYSATPLLDVDSETDSNHDTALTLACAGGHEELVELLLQRGANIEHCDKKGFTPLILAATAGHAKVVEALLTHSANIEAQSERTKDTPLSLACSGGRYEVVEILLARGANKEHRNVSDYTPLSLAASGGYVNIIKLLLEHGAEINSRTGSKLGISPLMLAAMNGHTQAVKLLLDMGSDINAQIETNRNTALTLACFQGRHEVVSLLLDRKANVEHRAKTGLTPLMEAASGGYVEVGKVLIEKGADVNAPPVPSSRDTALTIAADKGHLKFVELLISKGAQTEVKNKKGNSPMWLAANGGHLEVVQALLNAKTNINSEDNRKVSCLMAAFKKGHLKLVKFMVRHVSQFPSDQELERYICTLNDEELKKKCKNCAEFIRTAKEKQAQEANKNASILLDLLEKERTMEENRKASALRKKQKRKLRKQEKREEKRRLLDGDDACNERDDDEEEEEEDDDEAPPAPQPPPPPPPAPSEVISKKKSKSGSNVNNTSTVVIPEEKDGDSGIDSNSQTSASSEHKATEEKENSKGKKKKKKNETLSSNITNQKESKTVLTSNNNNINNSNDTSSTVTANNKKNSVTNNNNNNTIANNNNIQEKFKKKNSSFKNDNEVSSKAILETSSSARSSSSCSVTTTVTATNSSSTSATSTTVTSTASTKSKKKKEDISRPPLSTGNEFNNSDINLNIYLDMKTVGSKKNYSHDYSLRVNALDTFGEVDNYMSSVSSVTNSSNASMMYPSLSSNLNNLKLQSPNKAKREDGWKEVSRKSKRVSVPNHAISRVIGRGGSNINTIREVSGAHIEVEKQGKSHGDRMVIIKGSIEATRQAQTLINALVKDPDKDLSELLPKSVVKVPPKPPKSLISSTDLSALQGVTKNLRVLNTTALVSVTSTTLTSVYSSAKTNFSTTCAWASVTSPQKTPTPAFKSTVPLLSSQKSPAVRQLFTENKKIVGDISSTNKLNYLQVGTNENGQSFAAKLVDGNIAPKIFPQPYSSHSVSTALDYSNDKKDKPMYVQTSTSSTDQNAHQYSIFNNLLGQMPLCNKEKPLSFAKAASEGLNTTNKTPLGQQQQVVNNHPYLDSLEIKPVVDASRAPGFRGTIANSSSTSTISSKTNNNHLGPPPSCVIPSGMSENVSTNITIMKSVAACNAVVTNTSNNSSISMMGNKDVISSPLRSSSLGKIPTLGVNSPRSVGMNALEEITAGDLVPPQSSSISLRESASPTSASSTARSAPGTPVGSPSLRPVVPSSTRPFATPPPLSRNTEFNSASFSSLSGAPLSRTPPPLMTPAATTPANISNVLSQSRSRASPTELSASFASAMYITPLSTASSLSALAPGGPVSSHQRHPDQNDFINLAVGQPYHKVSPFSDLSNLSQNLLQQQVHQQSLQQQQVQFHQQQPHVQQIHQHQSMQQQQVPTQQALQHQQILSQQHIPPPQQQPPVQSLSSLPHAAQVPPNPQQQQQATPLNIAALMNGLRFTAPQTNTQPVFSNNILAPISAAPPIHSTLNPNAPDFASRAPGLVGSGAFATRTQLAAAYQNGVPSVNPSGYAGGGAAGGPTFAPTPNLDAVSLQAGLGDLMANLLPRNSSLASAATVAGGGAGLAAFRPVGLAHDSSSAPIGTRSSDQASPTHGGSVSGIVAAAVSAPVVAQSFTLPGEDRHSKLQPIGTERAQKRSERVGVVGAVPPPPSGLGVVGGNPEMLWTRPEILPPATAQVESVLPSNVYYSPDMEIPTYNPPIWNWGVDGNQ